MLVSTRRLTYTVRLFLCLAILSSFAVLSVRPQSSQAAANQDQIIALVGGTVIDGKGGEPIRDGVILIKGNRILRVGSRKTTPYPRSAKVIDVAGKYLVPGLIDMHIHYRAWMGEMFLANGVTTVKDLGNDLDWISKLSAMERDGSIRAPRVFYVGDGLDSPPPSRETHVAVENPLMARKAVDLEHSRGATSIKVREKITVDLLAAITSEAHKDGIPVTGHIRSIDARQAANAGIDGLEHTTGIVQALTNYAKDPDPKLKELQQFIVDQKAYALIDDAKLEKFAAFLAAKHVALVPTMSGWWRMATERRDDWAREDAEYAANPTLAYVPDDVKKLWATSPIYKLKSADDLATMRAGYAKLQKLLKWEVKDGGRVIAGSDTLVSVPGLSLQRELQLLVDAGFTPLQAITMGTRGNAEFLGQAANLGTLSAGKLADLVVVDADPLADIHNLAKVAMVFKGGKQVDISYHHDYSIPTPDPVITRPVWLEKQLEKYKTAAKAGGAQ